MAFTATASSGLTLGLFHPEGSRTAGTGPGPSCPGYVACMVFRALPHAARTVASGPAGMGSFLSPGSTSTTLHDDSERWRPLTHQLSVIRTPDTISAAGVAMGITSPNSGE